MTKKASPAERRRHLRIDYSRLISFTYYGPKKKIERPEGMAALQDLSESGILIQTGEDFPAATVLDLDLAFEQDKIIHTRGEVVHCQKSQDNVYNVGVKFTKIKKKDLEYLRTFTEAQKQK